MEDYLVRFSQSHETFRIAELRALAVLENVDLEIVTHTEDSPFCFIRVASEEAARRLVRRSILAKGIYELWGSGTSYESLHENLKTQSQWRWPAYKTCSFRFSFDSYQGTRTSSEQRSLIETFAYMAFEGPIRMKSPDAEFCVLEEWTMHAQKLGIISPNHVHLGRFVGGTQRHAIDKYDLKKRKYISTTSMDAELALVTANISLAAPGKLFYDPFVGTGSFPVACAHFGAIAWGSDIDGRSMRGKGDRSLLSNFVQYGIVDCFGDCFTADLTNTPLRASRLFDGILCDPPYGVREGLKVLGNRDPTKEKVPVIKDGEARHLQDDYIPPKRPYSFLAMLDDILDFAALSLVENGRLSFWMPTSNDEAQEVQTPTHPCLEITSICTQSFHRWSRKLITYRRLLDTEVEKSAVRIRRSEAKGTSADELNPFRKQYFEGFK